MARDGDMLRGSREAAGWPSFRAVAIGCILCAVTGLAGPYWTIYLQTSRMFADYHTAGATFFLFFLFIIFNQILGRLWRPLALRADELMTVGAMLLVGGAIVSSGLIAYFIPSISSAFNWADVYQWHDQLLPHMPKPLAPLDPRGSTIAINRYWTGLQGGQTIPWDQWTGPLLIWGVFLMSFFACMMAVMTIMRKQWMDHEHLSYPIAQVPAELCAAADRDRTGPSIFGSVVFWIGLAITFLLASSSGLGSYFGTFPAFRVRETIVFVEGTPWELHMYIEFVVIGLVFLIPNRIAFTVWAVALLSWFVRSFMDSYNLTLPQAASYGGEFNHLAAGAMLVFVVGTLWLSRRHLKRALKCALGLGERGYDRGEPSSYRSAFLLMLLGCGASIAWFRYWRLGLGYAVILVLLTLAVYYTMARVVAQCGLPMLSPPVYPNNFMASIFGSAAFGNREIVMMAHNYGWHFDMRNSVMSGSGHGMYLARRRRSGLLWPMLLGLLITYVAACICAVWVGYRYGGSTMDPWFYGNFPRLPWLWARNAITQHAGPSGARMVWAGVGGLIMVGLLVAQRVFFWWPLHPVGLLICSSHMVYFFWFSVFLAWLVKTLLMKFGGGAMYRPARRFFIGMVMGYFLAGGTWAIIDTLAGHSGNAVFYI